MQHLAQPMYKHQNRCVSCSGLWQLCGKVHQHTLPAKFRYRQRLQQASRLLISIWAARYNTWLLIELTPKGVVFSLMSGLDPLTEIACRHKVTNISVKHMPPISLHDQTLSPVTPQVTSIRVSRCSDKHCLRKSLASGTMSSSPFLQYPPTKVSKNHNKDDNGVLHHSHVIP